MVQHGFIGVHRRSSAAKNSLHPSHQHIAGKLTPASVRAVHPSTPNETRRPVDNTPCPVETRRTIRVIHTEFATKTHPSNGSRIRIVSSRSGLVDSNVTG